jgi:hypothetical protein
MNDDLTNWIGVVAILKVFQGVNDPKVFSTKKIVTRPSVNMNWIQGVKKTLDPVSGSGIQDG